MNIWHGAPILEGYFIKYPVWWEWWIGWNIFDPIPPWNWCIIHSSIVTFSFASYLTTVYICMYASLWWNWINQGVYTIVIESHNRQESHLLLYLDNIYGVRRILYDGTPFEDPVFRHGKSISKFKSLCKMLSMHTNGIQACQKFGLWTGTFWKLELNECLYQLFFSKVW